MSETDDELIAEAKSLAFEWTPGSIVVGVQRLQGGISAQMFALDVNLPEGERVRVVARFPSPELANYFADPVLQEFITLDLVCKAGIPAPRPLAHSAELLLMQHLEGTATAAPDDADLFVDQMAEDLAAIHETDLTTGRFDLLMENRFVFQPPQRNPNQNLRELEVVAAAVARAPKEPWIPVL